VEVVAADTHQMAVLKEVKAGYQAVQVVVVMGLVLVLAVQGLRVKETMAEVE
jgi:hypothetical protein